MSLTDQQYREVTMRWRLHLWLEEINREAFSSISSSNMVMVGSQPTAIDFWPIPRKLAYFVEAQIAYNSVSCTLVTTKLATKAIVPLQQFR